MVYFLEIWSPNDIALSTLCKEQSREREVEREEAAKLKLALEETRKEVKKKEEVIESKESQVKHDITSSDIPVRLTFKGVKP